MRTIKFIRSLSLPLLKSPRFANQTDNPERFIKSLKADVPNLNDAGQNPTNRNIPPVEPQLPHVPPANNDHDQPELLAERANKCSDQAVTLKLLYDTTDENLKTEPAVGDSSGHSKTEDSVEKFLTSDQNKEDYDTAQNDVYIKFKNDFLTVNEFGIYKSDEVPITKSKSKLQTFKEKFFNSGLRYQRNIDKFQCILNKVIEFNKNEDGTINHSSMKTSLKLMLNTSLNDRNKLKIFYECMLKYFNQIPIIEKVLLDNLYEGSTEEEKKEHDNKVQAIHTLIHCILENNDFYLEEIYSPAFSKVILKDGIQGVILRFYNQNQDGVLSRKDSTQLKKDCYDVSMKNLNNIFKKAKTVGIDSNKQFCTVEGNILLTTYNAFTNMGSLISAIPFPKTWIGDILCSAVLATAGFSYAVWRKMARVPTGPMRLSMEKENKLLSKAIHFMPQESKNKLFWGNEKTNVVLKKTRRLLSKSGGICDEITSDLGPKTKLQDKTEKIIVKHIHAKELLRSYVKNLSEHYSLWSKFKAIPFSLSQFGHPLAAPIYQKNEGDSIQTKKHENEIIWQNLHSMLSQLKNVFTEDKILDEENFKIALHFMDFQVDGKRGTFYEHACRLFNEEGNEVIRNENLTKLRKIMQSNFPKIKAEEKIKPGTLEHRIQLFHKLQNASYAEAFILLDKITHSVEANRSTCAQILHILDFGISENTKLTQAQKYECYSYLDDLMKKGAKAVDAFAPLFYQRDTFLYDATAAAIFYQGFSIKKYVHDQAGFSTIGINGIQNTGPDQITGSAIGWTVVANLGPNVDAGKIGKTRISKAFEIMLRHRKAELDSRLRGSDKHQHSTESHRYMSPGMKLAEKLSRVRTKKDKDAMLNEVNKKITFESVQKKLKKIVKKAFPEMAESGMTQEARGLLEIKKNKFLRSFLEGCHGQEHPLIVQLTSVLEKDDANKILQEFYFPKETFEQKKKKVLAKYPSNIAEDKIFEKYLVREQNKPLTQTQAVCLFLKAQTWYLHLESQRREKKFPSESKESNEQLVSLKNCKDQLKNLLLSTANINSNLRIIRKNKLNEIRMDKGMIGGVAAANFGASTVLSILGLGSLLSNPFTAPIFIPIFVGYMAISCGIRIYSYYKRDDMEHSDFTHSYQFILNRFKENEFIEQDFDLSTEVKKIEKEQKKLNEKTKALNATLNLASFKIELTKFIQDPKNKINMVNHANYIERLQNQETQTKEFAKVISEIIGSPKNNDENRDKMSLFIHICQIMHLALEANISTLAMVDAIRSLLGVITNGDNVFEGFQLNEKYEDIRSGKQAFFAGALASVGGALSMTPIPIPAYAFGLLYLFAQTTADVFVGHSLSSAHDKKRARKEAYIEIILFLQHLAKVLLEENEELKNILDKEPLLSQSPITPSLIQREFQYIKGLLAKSLLQREFQYIKGALAKSLA